MKRLRKFFQSKKDWLGAFLGIWLCVLVLIVAIFLHRKRDERIAIRAKSLIEQEYTYPLVEFEVNYKDGHIAKVKATSVTYGETSDNIYFLGQHNDTLQILPKVMVEEVSVVNNKPIKK